jgi:ABC-type Mn2+/Zn2+ transport system ATPase subunit
MSDATILARLGYASVRYGDVVGLRNASLTFVAGSSVALVGANGSGKSTMLELLGGLLRPTDGTVSIAADASASFVAQQHGQHRWIPLTVGEVLRMGTYRELGLLRPSRASDRGEIAAVAARLEVDGLLRRSFGELSGGQRQRVLMAQALVGAPRLLLLDEPITGLDLASQQTIVRIIAEEVGRGACVVFSTHHLDEARQAHRVVLLATDVVADGDPDVVLRPELLARAFAGRLVGDGDATMLVDDHGHGAYGETGEHHHG